MTHRKNSFTRYIGWVDDRLWADLKVRTTNVAQPLGSAAGVNISKILTASATIVKTNPMAISLARPGRGRPQKFGRPARAVTLTLPEDVLAVLTRLDDDVSRAVVRIVQPLAADVVPHAPAELSKHGDAAVIVIRPVAALERIPGVTLVPMPDGRALISLDDSMTTYEFELNLRDALDDRNIDRADLPAMQSILEILRSARQTRGVALQQRRIIVLQSTRRRRADRRAAP